MFEKKLDGLCPINLCKQIYQFCHFYSLTMRKSLVNLSGLLNVVTKVVTSCQRAAKDTKFVLFQ